MNLRASCRRKALAVADGALPGRFYAFDGAASAPESMVKAFLWLKRRIEEDSRSGFLAIPDAEFLDTSLTEALGWRLTEVMRDEGALPLGDTLAMEWTTLDAISTPSSRPLAAIHPQRRHLDLLRYWPGLVLVVPASGDSLADWLTMTGAAEPAAENYWPPDVASPPRR